MAISERKYDLVFLLFLLFLLILFKYPSLNLPYYWDGLNYIAPTIDKIYHGEINWDLLDSNRGHPLFLPFFIAFLFKIFGSSQLIANSAILFFSLLVLYFTYLIGKELFSRSVGIIASLLLMFTPIFFSYSAMLFLDVPLTALMMMSIYFSIKSKPIQYVIFSSLAILAKELGVLVVFGVLSSKLIKRDKNLIIYCSPLLIFFLSLLMNKLLYNQLFYPLNASVIHIIPARNLLNLLIILKTMFFDQYRWLLTSIFLISFIDIKKIKVIKNLRKLIFYSAIFLIALISLYNIDFFTKFFLNYYPNINIYFDTIKLFSPLFSFLFIVIILIYKKVIKFITDLKYSELAITLLMIISLLTFIIPVAARYLLPSLPIIFLLYSFSINKLFKNHKYLVLVIVIVIFSLNYFGNRSTEGFTLESNMEHIDLIKTHQLASSYIENNFPDSVVLAAFPQSFELKYPYAGYVKKPLNVATINPLPNLADRDKNFSINPGDIDIYYYSPQEHSSKQILDVKEQLNLTLIKRFEINNKSTEIYLVNK